MAARSVSTPIISRQPRFIRTDNIIDSLPPSTSPCTTISPTPTQCLIDSILDSPTTFIPTNPRPPCLTTQLTTKLVGSITYLQQAFLNNNLCIVSDGSSKDGIGAGAWIITAISCFPNHYLMGDIPSPGLSSGQDSHRAECAGIMGALHCFHNLLQTWGYSSGNLYYGCDNISALRYAFDITEYPNITGNTPDFDLLQSIRRSQLSTVQYHWRHVKGHQDTKNNVLNFWETLNVFADHAASERRQLITEDSPFYTLPHDNWVVNLQSGRVFKNLQDSLYDHWSLEPMRKYWCAKKEWSDETFNSIAWTSLQAAGRQTTTQRRHWICKHSMGFCGTNSVLVKWKQRDDASCTRCGQVETPTHVWKCTDPDSRFIWKSALKELDIWLEKRYTLPSLRNLIIQSLDNWLNDQPSTDNEPILLAAQNNIGWDYLIEGFLPVQWVEAQHQHYLSSNRLASGKRWATALILKFWNIAWDLWEHRNNTTHLANENANKATTNNEVQLLLQQGPSSPELASFYSHNEQSKLQSATEAYKKAWIAAVKTHSAFRKRKQRSEVTQMQATLRSFLFPTEP